MEVETKTAEFVDIPLTKTPIETQLDILKSAKDRFMVAITEAEELSILRDFGNAFHEVNGMIKQIPQQGVRGDQSTTAFITESRTEIQKYTKLLVEVKTSFEKIVKEKWQARVKYPIDWNEPDAWYALITLAMNHASAETRLVWDKIADASLKLDSLMTEVSSILDSILSLFGIKKTNSKTFTRSENDIKLDEERVTKGTESVIVTLPALKLPQVIGGNKNSAFSTGSLVSSVSKKRKWIVVVLFFVAFSVIVISWFSKQYGGSGSGGDSLNIDDTIDPLINSTALAGNETSY